MATCFETNSQDVGFEWNLNTARLGRCSASNDTAEGKNRENPHGGKYDART